ncbi:lipopolysaccharide biosynthesis protein [Microlunatus panaciterrae]
MAVVGRQASQMICALVLARLLGPDSYGVISAASVYVTLTTLFLDQGLAPALVQRPTLDPRSPGAVATMNLLAGLVLAVITFVCAPLIAGFFHVADLTGLLRVLAFGLLIKALAITPRAMQLRRLGFKVIGVGDIAGGVVGAVVGITAALLGAGYWAMAWQVITTDVVIAVVLLAKTRGTRPNLHLGLLGPILPFSLRIFASNGLAFFSRNCDNILVGRYLGVTSLSYYSMAYRVLVIPVQMLGQTVNRVTFPTLARVAADRQRVAAILVKVTELLAMAAVPPMVLVAVAAPEMISVVLGDRWLPTAPILSVLAIAGARETVMSTTQSLMRAMGRGKLIMRYEIVATSVQLTGIVVGLQFGLLGVAVGLTTAGFLLTPVMLLIQRNLSAVRIRDQLRTMLPAVHGSLWAAAAYLLVRLIGWHDAWTLVLGIVSYLVVGLAVLWLAHRKALRRTVVAAKGILGVG